MHQYKSQLLLLHATLYPKMKLQESDSISPFLLWNFPFFNCDKVMTVYIVLEYIS